MTLHWNYFEVYGHRPWRVYVEINTAHACAATSVIFMNIWITHKDFCLLVFKVGLFFQQREVIWTTLHLSTIIFVF